MSDIKAIILRGDFTDSEFAELAALIRRMDQARPDAHFEMVGIDTTTSGLETAERLMRAALPARPDRRTEWSVRRDRSLRAVISIFPGSPMPMPKTERQFQCSFCGKLQNEVAQLIAGPTSFICDECVDLCTTIVKEQRDSKKPTKSDKKP